MTASRSLLPLVFVVSAAGCVLPDQIAQVQDDVSNLRRQVEEIRRVQEQSRRELEELQATAEPAADDVTVELADMELRLDRVSRDASATDEKVNDLYRRLDGFDQEIRQVRALPRPGPTAASGDELSSPASAPLEPVSTPAAVPDPESLYNTAYLDFSKGNFDLAISGFEEYHERFSESPLADNALYWIGECRFSKGEYDAAIAAFDRLLAGYPDSDKAAAADLKKALAFQEQNLIRQAIVQLRYVIAEYPDSDEARIARDKLAALGQTPS